MLLQRQIMDRPPLADPGFLFKTFDIVILQAGMEQINLQAKTLLDSIEQTMPPQAGPRPSKPFAPINV